MLLDKVESGCLVLETQQGMLRIELSLGQRLYLLWTFRHFRHLSAKLLNSRQHTLVSTLYRNNSAVLASANDRLPVIGVIENFVPVVRSRLDVADAPQPVENEDRPEEIGVSGVETAHRSRPRFSKPGFSFASRIELPKIDWPVLAASKVAATVGWACLCIMFVMAWRRIQELPSLQARSSSSFQQAMIIAPQVSASSARRAIVGDPTDGSAFAATVAINVKQASNARAIRSHVAASKRAIPASKASADISPKPETSDQESAIEASRAPLHFIYPEHQSVRDHSIVGLIARVEADGTVQSVRVVSGKRALAAAAVRAVRQWRYRPFIKDGHAVATETNIIISFIARDAISMSFPPNIPAVP